MPFVIVQAEGDYEPLTSWSWWIDDKPEIQEEAWERLCLQLVKQAGRHGQDSATPLFNVFLVFDEEEFPDGLQQPALEHLLEQARKRIWGARLFFVIQPLVISVELSPLMASLVDWMNELVKVGVTDLLELGQSFTSENREPLYRALKIAAQEVKGRQQLLRDSADHCKWRCIFLTGQIDGRALVGELLQPLMITEPGERGDCNLVLVVADEAAIGTRLKTYVNDPLHRICLVATVRQVPSEGLRRLCKKHNLKGPLFFHGELELWYFLLRLNQSRLLFPSIFQVSELIRAVQTPPEPSLQLARQAPSLLFTSAFSFDDDQVAQWLAAAEEVGRLLRGVPHVLERKVELAIQPQRVMHALESSPGPYVWIHMGHGSANCDLQIPGLDVAQGQWVDCFSRCDLRLALFLTCDSHEIARLFAQSGAGVAIGFEGKVESDKTWHLAAEVLKAMFSRGTSCQVILEGFDMGAQKFRGAQTLSAEPRAYYPRGRR